MRPKTKDIAMGRDKIIGCTQSIECCVNRMWESNVVVGAQHNVRSINCSRNCRPSINRACLRIKMAIIGKSLASPKNYALFHRCIAGIGNQNPMSDTAIPEEA